MSITILSNLAVNLVAVLGEALWQLVSIRVGHPENSPPPSFRFLPEQGRKVRGFADMPLFSGGP